ncbi:sensor histidine kinase [Ornithinimicrobium flavum]|uniref:sensor histidine kinase n=1 Tax=Ornithinimicrobium flavum TaxID=1288636 RepID=UPI00106FF3EA|nr:ATP-binding protein [Ornithinimicrobium flavum]
MTPLAAGVLGLVLGALTVAVAWWWTRRPATTAATASGPPTRDDEVPVPAGVAAVLSVLRAAGIVVDRRGRVRIASATATAQGLVRGDALVHPRLREVVTKVLGDGTIRQEELVSYRGPLTAGRMVLDARVAPLDDGLVLILVDDRTQAHRVEEVRRDFVVNVSHELKTPVGGLALLAEAVADAANDPAAVARFARRMTAETQRLTRLVNEIVDLSRLQTSDLLTDMTIVDVAACAAEAVEHTRLVAGQRELVATPTGSPEELRVYGDRELITTAIRNLVTNAISYSEDGTHVAVVTRREGDTVEVSVTDQGRGISPADQERIFERFYRVDAARSRSTGGTGLGLSIVKHICANHGGEVTVWSEEGQGSTFTLRLPAVVDDPRPVGSPAPHRGVQGAGPVGPPDGAPAPASSPVPSATHDGLEPLRGKVSSP